MTLSFVLIDKQHLFREGLRALLRERSDWHLIADVDSARAARAATSSTTPDVLLVDVLTLGPSPLPALRELRRLYRRSTIVVLAGDADPARILMNARAAGANALVAKNDRWEDLVDAIEHATAGVFFVSPALTARMTQSRLSDAPDPVAVLSPREREIFDFVSQGLSTRAIARDLHVSEKTIETHRAHINAKLGFRSSADLVRFAAAHGLLPLTPGPMRDT